ncbi:MAG: hypothetical protein R2793_09850 [Flavobacteriaceae bacterium]
MYRLSFAIALFWAVLPGYAQSPHGDGLKIDCAQCHNPSGWTIDAETITFDHGTTNFELEGTHATTDCKLCHTTLVFNEVKSDCISCHLDVHGMTVGNDCMRCHDSNSWLVANIPELHEENGFPLIGTHSNLSCVDCHFSESSLRFDRIGNECISCHLDDYASAQNPNHITNGFSQDCLECHTPFDSDWDSQIFNHDFFPLTLGHDIQDCSRCHDVTNFSNISAECVFCHQEDYAQTSNPNHASTNFTTDCVMCHTTNPGWTPAIFDHGFFPLTLGHDIENCNACHINGNYNNTPTDCFACHQNDYVATTNPDHEAANFPTNCVACHTTNPGWMPAVLNHGFFPLTLGHDIEDCTACHINNNYNNTPTDCFACHQNDYNATTNPDHEAASFPTDCVACHTTNPGWVPATFDHDGMYFPIYDGNHAGEWDSCIDCHTTPNNYAIFDCIVCHTDAHNQSQGNQGCFNCHPNGD